MILIETAFKQYGKKHIISFLRDYVTTRINLNMTIDKCIYTLSSYDLLTQAEQQINEMRNNTDFYKYK